MKKGQTLLEVIIATAIIGIGLVAVLSLVVQSMVMGHQSKEYTQATFLAQESIELIVNLRDSNFKKKQDWLSDFNWSGDGYYSYNNGLLTYLGEQKPENGEEVFLDNTSFYRFIKLSVLSDNDYITDCELEISIEVIWPSLENPENSVILSSIITNWRSNEN